MHNILEHLVHDGVLTVQERLFALSNDEAKEALPRGREVGVVPSARVAPIHL